MGFLVLSEGGMVPIKINIHNNIFITKHVALSSLFLPNAKDI
jgi:hypothetical protein